MAYMSDSQPAVGAIPGSRMAVTRIIKMCMVVDHDGDVAEEYMAQYLRVKTSNWDDSVHAAYQLKDGM